MSSLIPRSLERGLGVLQMAAAQPAGLSFSEITAKLALPNVTVSRLLTALCGLQYLEHDAGNSLYRPGPELTELGMKETTEMSLRRVGLPLLEEFSESTRHTCLLIQWTGRHALCLERLLQPESIVMQDPGYITQSPFYSPWGVFFLTSRQWRECFQETSAGGRHPQATPDFYEQEMRRLMDAGYTCAHTVDKRRIAAPVYDRAGQVIGALAAGGTIAALNDERIAEDGVLLASLAREFTRRL